MALEKDLQDYLKSRKDVQEARNKLQEAKSKASQLSSALASAPQSSKASVQEQLNSAKAELNSFTSDFKKIESEAKTFYRANKESIQAGISKGKTAEATTNLEDAKRTRDALAKAGQSTAALDRRIAELESNIAGGFKYVSSGGTVSGEPNVNQNKEVQPENFDELSKTAREFVKNTLDNKGRLELANKLKAAGIPNVPITGEYTDALATAYKSAIGSAKSSWNAFKEYATVEDFLNEQARQVSVLKAAGGGAEELPKPFGEQAIYNKSTAEGVIDNLFQSLLKRDASESEISSLYKELQAEQKKLSSISKGTYKMVDGRRVLVQETGLDPRVFLENKIKSLPAYKESQAAKAEQNKLSLAATALANGYDLERDFSSQLPNWLDAMNKGESISKFQSTIRNSARLALPEAVRNSIDPNEDLTTAFATYISNFSKTFGVPASQVSLNKILPLATNDKGFIPIYEFEKKKRQLAEWDTTQEARTETAGIVSTVLKDFGFKG
jgi:phage gp16-like protein